MMSSQRVLSSQSVILHDVDSYKIESLSRDNFNEYLQFFRGRNSIDEGLTSKEVHSKLKYFALSWTDNQSQKEYSSVDGGIAQHGRNCVFLGTPLQKWLALAVPPNEEANYFYQGGKPVPGGACELNASSKLWGNKFVIIEPISARDTLQIEGNSFGPIKFRTIWDPKRGIHNAEFEAYLRNWVQQIDSSVQLPKAVTSGKDGRQPMSMWGKFTHHRRLLACTTTLLVMLAVFYKYYPLNFK